ncbi:hypothetical protein [Okeania sp. SIO2B3]|uniref:hypothetical protein n=1 Tax=Okeania sp. SIO2B3 TaxID=2607784 RepID=UPI0013BFFBB1|nr:hypothetical protein [Okeania sp. SIO2B3]NET40760.1 hypothetical protein [Okeania sp. SIO2B3]
MEAKCFHYQNLKMGEISTYQGSEKWENFEYGSKMLPLPKSENGVILNMGARCSHYQKIKY